MFVKQYTVQAFHLHILMHSLQQPMSIDVNIEAHKGEVILPRLQS